MRAWRTAAGVRGREEGSSKGRIASGEWQVKRKSQGMGWSRALYALCVREGSGLALGSGVGEDAEPALGAEFASFLWDDAMVWSG